MHDSEATETRELMTRLNAYWTQTNVSIRPGSSDLEIEAFESRYYVRLPADLREYFATIGGMEENAFDENMFSFIPRNGVKSIPEELVHFCGLPDYTRIIKSIPDPSHWFVIVDYLISSAVFAIRLERVFDDTPVMVIYDGTNYRVVASSFANFLEAYLSNPLGLL
jgi:hypothetical protein